MICLHLTHGWKQQTKTLGLPHAQVHWWNEFATLYDWLFQPSKNNDLLLVGNFYSNNIKQSKTVPKLLRMNAGTEKTNCQGLLVYFTDFEESFLYATSTRNQRTETLWLRLKRWTLSGRSNFLLNQIANFKKSCFCLFFCYLYKKNWMNIWWHLT